MNGKNFWVSQTGKSVLTAICCVVLWGLTMLIWCYLEGVATLLVIPFAVVGWKKVTQIQPAMFVRLPLIGWFVYFLVKFVVSTLVGLFATPFMLGPVLADKIYEAMDQ